METEREIDQFIVGNVPPTNTPNLMGFPSPYQNQMGMNGFLNEHEFDLFRRRGSSALSASYRTGNIQPLEIPSIHHNNNTFTNNLDIDNVNTEDFIRSAPINGALDATNNNHWDQAITWNSPSINNEQLNTTTPEFMKSSFYTQPEPVFNTRRSIESMSSLIHPNQPAPQSAPVHFGQWGATNFNGDATNMIIDESDIFESLKENRNRNWSALSTMTTESENEPIINLLGGKRGRRKSMSEPDLLMPPIQKMRRNTNDHQGIGVLQNSMNLPPFTPTIIDGVNDLKFYNNQNEEMYNIPPEIPQKRKRGRPKKIGLDPNKPKNISKLDRMSKAEREKLRRHELKNGYSKLTNMLNLNGGKGGNSLPDRSMIVARACDEIKRLEKELFSLSMRR